MIVREVGEDADRERQFCEVLTSVGGQRVTAPRTPGAKLFFPMLAVVGTGFQMFAHAMGLLLTLGIPWLVVKLAPGRTQHALDYIEREPGSSFVVGLLLWALLIPSVIALALVIALSAGTAMVG